MSVTTASPKSDEILLSVVMHMQTSGASIAPEMQTQRLQQVSDIIEGIGKAISDDSRGKF